MTTRFAHSPLFTAFVLLGTTHAAFPSAASAAPAPLPAPVLGPSTLRTTDVDTGEVLFSELNCIACHSASETVRSRLAPRLSPVLGPDGMPLTPQYLRSFLTSPHAEKPGSTMPDLLHGLDAGTKAETVDALVHYLVSLAPATESSPTGADQLKMQQGLLLYHQTGCVACHAPVEPASAFRSGGEADSSPSKASEQAVLKAMQASSVPLGNLAKKTTVEALTKFLGNPLQARPSGRMPSLNLNETEASALAVYLLREQAPAMYDPSALRQKIKGLSYQYFEGRFGEAAPNFDSMRPRNSGVVETFKLDPRRRNNNFGLRFTGLLTIETEGDYTFFSESDDGSRVYIGSTLVVKNDGLHAMSEAQGTLHLKAGDHPITVTYFNSSAEYGLKVFYQGPGLSKREIPASVLSHLGQPMIPLETEKLVLDQAKVARGKESFSSLGCAACHPTGNQPVDTGSKVKAMDALNPDAVDGCLSSQVRPGKPQFHLSDFQRRALRSALASKSKLAASLTANARITRTMTALNCWACHSRDGAGGPEAARAEYFSSVGEVDLGDEGRMPPHLAGVGAKLRPEWLREVLVNRGVVRPYMATRMPQFGRANVEQLAADFEKTDREGQASPASELPAEISMKLAKSGHKLVGRDGLTCVSCHTFAQFKSLGIPAMDMTQMAKRLSKDWFRRYLLDPASLRPGTRMPTFWPDGAAANKEILGGNTEQQIEAIWAYLSRGRDADVPAGLIQAKMELLPDKEAIIYRNFFEGAGARAIAVGYPEKANLAFDAAQLRLAMIWQGAFLDASRHRSDRGAGNVPPLGSSILRMPPGPAFAILSSSGAPWPDTGGKKGGFEMRGYRLDEKRRPTFLYAFKDIEIEDYLVATRGETDPAFTRTLTLRSNRPEDKLWFRAAVGSKIEPKPGGEYLVDGKLALRIRPSGPAKPVIRQTGGQSELLVPVAFQDRKAEIIEEMIW